jgi:hypothetical protein
MVKNKGAKMKPKEILAIAEDYVAMKGDDDNFSEIYGIYRNCFNVRESVKNTLRNMYGECVCEMITGEK